MKKTLSLTSRLTLLFGLILTCVLAALGFYILGAMRSHFVEQDQGVLKNHAEEIREILEHTGNYPITPAVKDRLDHTMSRHDIDFEIIGKRGEVLYRNEARAIPEATIREMVGHDHTDSVEWHTGKNHFRSMLLDGKEFDVIVSVSTGHHEEFLESFGKRLLGVLSLIFLITWGLSWFAVRKGLAPLKMIKDRAASVTLSNLNKVIPVEQVPVELVPLVAELNNMMSRLEESFRRLVAFSSDLAHEMRTPVSNLLTQIQVVLAQNRDAEDYRDVLASSSEECERLSRMISEMLFLAKAENGSILPSVERVDLSEQVGNILEYFEALADSKGITLTSTGNANLECDRSMLRRALSNLVSNAIRYGAPNSVIETSIDSGHSWIDVSVRNCGQDISQEHLSHIFDRFYRANAARSHEEHDGLGLGLAITRAIMSAHGGHVEVESKIGYTTFTLRFPSEQPRI